MTKAILIKSSTRLLASAICIFSHTLRGDDRVFSGPQPGEKTTPFKVVALNGPAEGTERDVIADHQGAPTALVFLHGLERSLVPLLTAIDQYGSEHTNRLKTELIFLAADRLAGEQRFKAAAKSLRLQGRLGISPDGAEGPGNYGLNKECLMTVVVASENKVTANFALVQPGIADAPKVIAALARVSGDTNPPTVEALQARRQEKLGNRNDMAADSGMKRRNSGRPADFSKMDLNSEAGLRDAVKALIAEVQSLRRDLAELRGQTNTAATAGKPKEDFPGKPPTDEKLMSLLRRFIQPANDEATVDRVLNEVDEYVKSDVGLRQQAIDGWTRVLHFGDHYGTAYARKQGQARLVQWQQQK